MLTTDEKPWLCIWECVEVRICLGRPICTCQSRKLSECDHFDSNWLFEPPANSCLTPLSISGDLLGDFCFNNKANPWLELGSVLDHLTPPGSQGPMREEQMLRTVLGWHLGDLTLEDSSCLGNTCAMLKLALVFFCCPTVPWGTLFHSFTKHPKQKKENLAFWPINF